MQLFSRQLFFPSNFYNIKYAVLGHDLRSWIMQF